MKLGNFNIIKTAMVGRQKIIFPVLHIKLGLMASFITALNKEGNGFLHLKNAFPNKSEAKISAGVFDTYERFPFYTKIQSSGTKSLAIF